MMQREHRICYSGGEAIPESLKTAKPEKAPQRGPGIAELEKRRRVESLKRFSRGTELVFHPLRPQPSTAVPFLPVFDPSSPFGYYVESFPMFRSQLLDLNPQVSSDGTMPLLWNSFQSDTPSSSNSQLSPVISDLKDPPWEPELLFPLQKHELQQQISQEMNHSLQHSVPGAGLQMELELPSNQSRYGIVNASSWADQHRMMHQIGGMNHQYSLQKDVAQIQSVTAPEPTPISGSSCGTMAINERDCSLSLHNVGVNFNGNHPTTKMIGASEEDVAEPIDESTLSLVCSPSVSSCARSPKTMSIRQFSEMNFNKRQKRTEESEGCRASATPSEALVFYNFMELPYNDYIADRDMIASQNKRSRKASDAVDVDLKL